MKYGVMKKIQKGLSEVRTDLDSFNDLEAYALMYSGYKQMMHEKDSGAVKKENWNFLKIADSCTYPEKEKQLAKQLKVSNYVPFKIVRMSQVIRFALLLFGGILLIGVLYYLVINWYNPNPFTQINIPYRFVGFTLLVVLAGYWSKILATVINIESVVKKKLALLVLITIGWFFSLIYITIFNPLYNKLGKVK